MLLSRLVRPFHQVIYLQLHFASASPFPFLLTWAYCWSFIVADQNTQAFKEVAIIRHPRIGEYAIGFITSSVVLQVVRYTSLEDFYSVPFAWLPIFICLQFFSVLWALHLYVSIISVIQWIVWEHFGTHHMLACLYCMKMWLLSKALHHFHLVNSRPEISIVWLHNGFGIRMGLVK